MLNPRARKTIAHVEAAIAEERSTAINDVIQIIQELASKAFSISIEDLSQLIGRDPTITERVISAANTLAFNPSATQIQTISEAIHTIGFEKVRNLAISLMLAENAGLNLNAYEQREVAALSVCSGMLAQSLGSDDEGAVDADLLFVCASLRNYGKLVLSSFLTRQYREAQALALQMEDDEAFHEVFGLTPLSLGRRLLRSTTLPKSIKMAMRETYETTLSRIADNRDDRTLLIADLSGKVCSAVFDSSIPPDEFQAALVKITATYQRCFPVSAERINQGLTEVEAKFSQLNRVIGIRDESSAATMKLRARVSGDFLPEPPAESRRTPLAAKKDFDTMDAEEREQFAEESFQKALASISEKLVPGERVNLQEIYQITAETIMEGLDLENCLVFVREEFDPQNLSARFGYGKLFERVKNRPMIGPQKKDIFSICLTRKEDVLIQDPMAGKVRSVIPEWIHLAGQVSSFLILPVNLEKSLFAIIIGTVSGGRVLTLKDGDLRRLRLMRSQLATLKKMVDQNAVVAN